MGQHFVQVCTHMQYNRCYHSKSTSASHAIGNLLCNYCIYTPHHNRKPLPFHLYPTYSPINSPFFTPTQHTLTDKSFLFFLTNIHSIPHCARNPLEWSWCHNCKASSTAQFTIGPPPTTSPPQPNSVAFCCPHASLPLAPSQKLLSPYASFPLLKHTKPNLYRVAITTHIWCSPEGQKILTMGPCLAVLMLMAMRELEHIIVAQINRDNDVQITAYHLHPKLIGHSTCPTHSWMPINY